MNNNSAHNLIPGGAHTYSKGDDQFPVTAPQKIERAAGCRVYDSNGREYLDWTMGLRSTPLGYGNPVILKAVQEQILKGPNFPRPSQLEEEVAKNLLSCVPKMDMVKFAKNGSNVTTAAVKLARAFTGRDFVACCQDHPFFSFDDWFIGSTNCPSGVPASTREMTLTFPYNDLDALRGMFKKSEGKIACLIMEAATDKEPLPDYLKAVEQICRDHGTLFILDEMITGFRFSLEGAAGYFDLTPDMMTFGKGLGNGFSVAALVGRRDVMEQGSITPGNERLFLLSATHGAENHSLAAALAAIQFYKSEDTISKLWKVGKTLKDLINNTAKDLSLTPYIKAYGFDCSPSFLCNNKNKEPDPAFRTLFLQEMARQGVIINFLAPSISHGDEAMEITRSALIETMKIYTRALDNGYENYLEGPIIKPVFRPIN